MSEYLNPTALHALTGFARPGKQSEWLLQQGIAHRVDGHRVIVTQRHVDMWLEGKRVVFSGGPNWGAVK